MKRRAHLKFISKNVVEITTVYLQKQLKINDDDYIDLINLSRIPYNSTNTKLLSLKFYAACTEEDGENTLFVFSETRDGLSENIGCVSLKENNKTFQVNLKD